MSLAILERALELGLIFSILSLGVYKLYDRRGHMCGMYGTGTSDTGTFVGISGRLCVWLDHSFLTDKNENSCVIGRNLDHDCTLFHQS